MTPRFPRHCALALLASSAFAAPAELSVDLSQHLGPVVVDRWSSSGLTQPYETACFRQDMQQIGAVPYDGCRFMRPHDLLDRVGYSDLDGKPAYEWGKLDSILDTITIAGLTPFVELMGNPSRKFSNFADKDQARAWSDLVEALARHLESRYGRDAVRGWMFESWNEPDISFNWKWKNEAEYLSYFDSSEAGLHRADPALRFGGPDTAKNSEALGAWALRFLDHCDTGKNTVTGATGTRLDFISYHSKGRPPKIVTREVGFINTILKAHPKYATLPILDDEADSEVGWAETKYEFRATPWYAAFIIRNIDEHLIRIVDGGDIDGHAKIDYRLSNDDAFWAGFVGRTQFARFGTDEQFALVKKPSHLARVLLSLMSGERAKVEGGSFETGLGAMASVDGEKQAAILLYNYSDTTPPWASDPHTAATQVHVRLSHLPFSSAVVAVYRIDADHSDTYGAWQALGSPEHPSDGQIQALRAVQELNLAAPLTAVVGSDWDQTLSLPQPGVCLILFTAPMEPQGVTPIAHLRMETYPSLSGRADDLMLRWDNAPRGIRTYSVMVSPAAGQPFARVNPADLIETGYLLERPHPAEGQVRIDAYDMSGRLVAKSDVLDLGRAP